MFGIDFFDPETMWLNITNLALGILTLLALLAIVWGIVAEVVERLRARVRVPEADDHLLAVPGLGLTMADGGSKLEDHSEESGES